MDKKKIFLNKRFQIIGLIIILFCCSFKLWEEKTLSIEKCNWYKKTVDININNNVNEKFEYIENNEMSLPSQEVSLTLNALYACLMDGESNRVLYTKNAYKQVPMASTTKIMTLLVTLEKADLNSIVTVSANAAKQPNVQLNINTGEQYILGDLCYSLMLESHNDTAVAIAEHVGGDVENFCNLMTQKARELGAYHTSFKTPNGLDAQGHYTTAYDLSLIASYAIQNPEFCKIVGTTTYQFDEVNRKRSFMVNNKDRFLYMMEGAIGIKTGFTGLAGYCFVGAIRTNEKTLISTVLASGWPPHKEYKWTDTRKLMKYGQENFTSYYLIERIQNKDTLRIPNSIPVVGGKVNDAKIALAHDICNEKLLFRSDETATVNTILRESVNAPMKEGTKVGSMKYYISGCFFKEVPIVLSEDVEKVDFFYLFRKLLQL